MVTESFAPRTDEVADTSRHVVEGLLARAHEVLVITNGPGMATWRGARVVRSRRLLPTGAVSSTVSGFSPDLVIVISPRVLGNLTLRHALRVGTPTIAIDPTAVGVQADRTLATSEAVREQLSSAGLPVTLWTPGTALDEHHPRLRDERLRSAWARRHPLVVGHVGPLEKEKVVARLEKIAAMEGVRLVVIGDGPGAARLKAAGAKITTAMSTLDVARAIASLDVLVQPRKKDSAVPGVRRALASGVPVVAFDAGGARDVVRDGENGLLVAADRNGLRRAVRRFLDEPDLRQELAGNARASVQQRDWESALDELAALASASVGRHAVTA